MRTSFIAAPITFIAFWLGASPMAYGALTTPPPPTIEAAAYILVDYNSHKVLASKDPDQRIDPASLTKMMTVYAIDHELKQGRLKLEEEVPISPSAWKTEGSRMFAEVGKKIPVHALLKGIIIQSGNDASVALAEYVAGTESAFADIMNQYAKQLGMQNTHFTNATGIPDPDHYTTAHDMALLARALIRDFPETYKTYSEKWFTFNGIKQPNRNRLLWREPYIDGIKTGHSSTAGYCLAASGQKDNMRLISIIAGAPSEAARTDQTLQLLRYGFRFFETHAPFQAEAPIYQTRIWMGAQKKLPLGVEKPLYVTIPQGQYANLSAKMVVDKHIDAPIKQGTSYGKVVVILENEPIAEAPLVALESIPKGTFWARCADYVSLGLHKILPSRSNTPATELARASSAL